MSKITTFFRLLFHDKKAFDIALASNIQQLRVLNFLSDKLYLEIIYKLMLGKRLNWDNPTTFNEKLQWLKLYDRRPEYTTMVDKYAVKEYVANVIGEEYIIPTLGVWNKFEDIDFDALPDKFVLKCTHDSGSICICKNKESFDIKSAKKVLVHGLKRSLFYHAREWPYKNVPHRIIAEQFMQDGDKENLPVYKIFNFGGEPKIIQVIQDDKTPKESIDYFDTEWNRLDLRQNFPNSEIPLEKPKMLEEMLELAKKLSVGFPFIRTDFYTINGKIYFSEYTFYSDAGFAKFTPDSWDETLGSWISLPEKSH